MKKSKARILSNGDTVQTIWIDEENHNGKRIELLYHRNEVKVVPCSGRVGSLRYHEESTIVFSRSDIKGFISHLESLGVTFKEEPKVISWEKPKHRVSPLGELIISYLQESPGIEIKELATGIGKSTHAVNGCLSTLYKKELAYSESSRKDKQVTTLIYPR
jgi:hypothetical protein